MNLIEERIGLEDIEAEEHDTSNVPETVYVSKKGKFYYPSWCKRATIEMPIELACEKGYKPSEAYQDEYFNN